MESLSHTIILIIWIPSAHDNLYCDFRQLPQIHPIASSSFYTTLCGEQNVGPTTSMIMISNSNNFLRFAHINFFYYLIIFLLLSFQNGSPNISKEVFFKAELLNRRNVFIPINRRLLSLLYSMNNFTAIKCNTMVICCNSDLR